MDYDANLFEIRFISSLNEFKRQTGYCERIYEASIANKLPHKNRITKQVDVNKISLGILPKPSFTLSIFMYMQLMFLFFLLQSLQFAISFVCYISLC